MDVTFQIVFSNALRPATVVHKCVLYNCLITLLFCNSPMFSGVKLIVSVISN